MIVRRRRAIGGVLDAFVDAASAGAGEIADTATSFVDAVSDAGKEIGSVLKFVAPIVALWPGIGTGLSIAMSAAAAYACGDRIEDAAIDIASSAIPGGVPRAAFNGAAEIAKTAVRGGNVTEASLRACRAVASSAGGDRAVAAFDTAVAVAKGDKVKGSMWALARKNAAQGGAASLAAFDAAYAVEQGGNAGDATLAAARGYIRAAGGPIAAAAFDGGVAIARGKALQDAGFEALKAFAAGDELSERAVEFADKMARAVRSGEPLERVLVRELADDVDRYGAAASRSGAGDGAKAFVAENLGPLLANWPTFRVVLPGFDDWGSYALAAAVGLGEPLARAAQAIMRDVANGGEPDQALADHLMKTGVANAIDKFGAAVVAARSTNQTYTETKAAIRSDQLMLVARMAPKALSYATAKAEQAPPAASVAAPEPFTVEAPPAPSSPARTSTLGDVALGGTIAAAIVALAWWGTSK